MAERAPVELVGLHGGEWFGAAAGEALQSTEIVVGAARHLASVKLADGTETVELEADLGGVLDRVAAWRDSGRRVCLLASGDPGFFGLARLATSRLGPGAVRVHPAPSAVSLAFARAGLHWDDAVVVSAHGRDAGPAVDAALHHPKVAVLCSPATPPEEIGGLLLAHGLAAREVTVAARLGEANEAVWHGDLAGLAAGRFDPLSVVVLHAAGPPSAAGWAWGRPESAFSHRGGMITKSEVRAVALGKLHLRPAGVMWDVGAGSGSVSAECAALAPGLRIYAVEKAAADVPMLRDNLAGTTVTVVEGEAPAALASLPDPDRAFVGGGGIDVLDAVLARLRPGGVVVATYASPGRAAEAAGRLGTMVQVSVSRAVPIGPDGGLRLAAENPVFVCWGPS
ncbi:MAG TPA: precorrin-6y C5,15-methyltransferase (decarboxylating) subunit CbiE [Acidimicrobiales bacterium]|nr:precorrin-6y C5,15-methyltransferase (decarboxylating) subunit CbiE [Acidimicrobiales bacterium]